MSEQIIQAGTVLTIDNEFILKYEKLVSDGTITAREDELFQIAFFHYKDLFPIKIGFENYRLTRHLVFLSWYFLDDNLARVPNMSQAYLSIFRKMGYEVIIPEHSEIPLAECPDNLLPPRDLVKKYFIRHAARDHKSRAWAESVFGMVEDIMEQHGVVFYTP